MMTDRYKIFGSELSPYSVKIRSWFRYKQIPHAWTPRNPSNMDEYQKHARLPIIPLVVTPSGTGIQDSTPIMDALDSEFPEPVVNPGDAVCNFLSILIEEFADEWGNKWMFHYRWARQADQLSAATRIARSMAGDAGDEQVGEVVGQIVDRMTNRVWFVGSNTITAPIIEQSFRDAVEILDAHLANRSYLFGERPAYADFALWGQIYNAWTDPTPGSLIESRHLNLLGWIQRMLWPAKPGEFERLDSLEETLLPLLKQQVGGLFIPWTLANEKAIGSGDEEFTVELDAGTWTQKPQKYHAKSLGVLRDKYRGLQDNRALNEILDATGCLTAFKQGE